MQPSDLVLIAARPSMGKTAFELNLARHAAFKKGLTVAIFSLEMSKEQLVNRMLSMESSVDSQKLHMIYGLGDGFRIKVIVTYSDLKAKEIFEEYKFYDRNVMLYPAKDLIFFQADIHGNQLVKERVKVCAGSWRRSQ